MVYEVIEAPLPGDLSDSSPESQQALAALAACIECHSAPSLPTLADMYGAQAGSQAGVAYSPSLQAANFNWTEQRLIQYLLNPEDVVPDGWMIAPPLDEQAAMEIVAALRTLGDETQRED
jgi:cytochrome c2